MMAATTSKSQEPNAYGKSRKPTLNEHIILGQSSEENDLSYNDHEKSSNLDSTHHRNHPLLQTGGGKSRNDMSLFSPKDSPFPDLNKQNSVVLRNMRQNSQFSGEGHVSRLSNDSNSRIAENGRMILQKPS